MPPRPSYLWIVRRKNAKQPEFDLFIIVQQDHCELNTLFQNLLILADNSIFCETLYISYNNLLQYDYR